MSRSHPPRVPRRMAFPLGKVLRRRKVSARELARRCKVKHARIEDVRSGVDTPSWAMLLAIAAALDVPLCAFDPRPRPKGVLPHVH